MTDGITPNSDSRTRLIRPAGPVPPADRSTDTPMPVRSFGRFRVEREIGRGGMGVVLQATDPTLNRPVALKLLRDDEPDAVARFRREAHALAGLAHPNAVRVYEFGEHAGRPYLAMEYVPGRTLADTLLAEPLDPRRAAELLAAVAGAVQAAHTAGVIHRDLKPANILIDPDGQPKLTDFGLARPTDRSSDLTVTAALVGTPQYMAPEQATGRTADARTDVYGLGATLYQCLTGRPPFAGPPAAVLRQLATDDPLPPSRLNPAVPRDLETVCLKCLEKEPAGRYPTAAAVADDLNRYLAGQPIAARPVGPVGRAARWVRRHRSAAALLSVTGLSLVGVAAAAGAAAVQAVQARQAESVLRQEAEVHAAEAADKAAEAEALNDFLLGDLLALAAGDRQLGAALRPDPNLTVRAALDRAAAKVGERFAGRPAVEERVRATLGTAYFGVGAHEAAVGQYRPALDSRRRRLGPDHPTALRLGIDLAFAYRETNRPAEALRLLEDVFPRCKAALPPGHPDTLTALSHLASAYKSLGRYPDALAAHAECLRLRTEHLGPEHPATLGTMNNLAEQLRLADRPREALPLAEESAFLVRMRNGSEHPDTLHAVGTLAAVYAAVGRSDEAVDTSREVLAGSRRTHGPGHPYSLSALNTVGLLAFQAGRRDEGLAALEESLTLHRKHLGPDHARAVHAAAILGWAYLQCDRPADAAPLFEFALPARQRIMGERHPVVLGTMLDLTTVYHRLGRWPAALGVLEAEVRLRTTATPPDPKLPLARGDLGECLVHLGRFAEAEPHLLSAHEYCLANRPPDDRARARARLAELYTRWGRPADAAHWREAAPAPRRSVGG